MEKPRGKSLIVCALLSEAKPIIHTLGLRQYETRPHKVFRGKSSAVVLISGVGGASVTKALQWISSLITPEHILLTGTAAALDRQIPLGSVFSIETLGVFDVFFDSALGAQSGIATHPVEPGIHNSASSLAKASCITVHQPYVAHSAALELNQNTTAPVLIDMEAWYFNQACEQFLPSVSRGIIKVVSDYGDDTILTKDYTAELMGRHLDQWVKDFAG